LDRLTTTSSTFAQLAHSVAVKFVSDAAVDGALSSIGGKANWIVADLPIEKRSALIQQFVRALRDTGVHTATRLEHALLHAAHCPAAGRRVISLKDAISLIAVRNQVHQLATGVGLSWNESMRLQSAISDLTRFIVEKGGGRVEIEDTSSALFFMIYANADLGPCTPPEATTPPWLVGTVNLAQGFRCGRAISGTQFQFWHGRPQSMVA
jgi:hypothetical protein